MGNTDQDKDSPIAVGREKPDDESVEVGGRAKGALYTCFCGAANYVTADQTLYICWKCGSGGHEHGP